MKLKSTFAVGSLVATFSLGALAQGTGAVEMEAFGKRYFTDSSRDIENGNLYGGSLGYFLSNDLALVLSYGEYHDMTSYDAFPPNGHKDVKGNLAALDGVYHFGTPGAGLRPYVSGGFAHQNISNLPPRTGRDHSTFANVGAGLKYYFTENLFAKAGLDGMYNLDAQEAEWMAGVGVGVNFGGSSKAAKPAPVAPPEVCSDSDNDGVCDNVDKCPDTAANVTVDESGCPAVAEVVRVELDVKFDFDKSRVKEESYGDIKNLARFMNQYPATTTTVEGHTDSVGPDAYNQKLSERRANAVRDVLVSEYGVGSERVSAIGYGETRPVADNASEAGRAVNRRVEAEVETQVK
ncbi:OmpA-OmpF porin, OOP family [Pseudomonas delhiensis]|uniref:OmpA-OmpF porin, OOP family n=1 Tax=Pseudomonas delhiensis TaxID=366289 RepID=A0A239NHU5_9PSED|nr:OmpA family protein [Pseudomonas delhiensis]SDK77915.1 OmpA-OmpF porin, OOP family [Pseudomonas delhiensis]SNT54023.1 OmpA-OmpF porin, OOP family [Pseudomonas delhiensis]